MREAFGGTFMIKLALIFIIIYVSFMAVAINYAKAFRVKNGVINIVEQYQYSGSPTDTAIQKIDDYLADIGYDYSSSKSQLQGHCSGGNFIDRGVCIVNKGDTDNPYYKVTTYIYIELPFFQINMTIPISGETKIIYA